MQVKPRFKDYKILEQYPLLKDDTSNEICLTLLEVTLPDNDLELMETSYKFWSVMGKNQVQWNNKAISYSHVAFWKEDKKDKLLSVNIKGFLIKEEENGFHNIFDNKKGLRTIFKITKE